jgi:hypothetical protein
MVVGEGGVHAYTGSRGPGCSALVCKTVLHFCDCMGSAPAQPAARIWLGVQLA